MVHFSSWAPLARGTNFGCVFSYFNFIPQDLVLSTDTFISWDVTFMHLQENLSIQLLKMIWKKKCTQISGNGSDKMWKNKFKLSA